VDDYVEFKCLLCGNCCRIPGYVRVSEAEIDRIAEYVGIEVYEFISTYTRLTNCRRGLSLIEHEDGSCVFLRSDGRCLIEDVKPEQCQKFPFDWRYDNMNEVCAGWRARKTASSA
jgi:Fe-S-cluster containining protein